MPQPLCATPRRVIEALSSKFMTSREFRVHMAAHFARISDEVEGAMAQQARDLGMSEVRGTLPSITLKHPLSHTATRDPLEILSGYPDLRAC